jgi:hypothetical protein
METINKPGKHTVNTVIPMMKKTQSIELVDTPVLPHETVRLVIRGGRKSALHAGAKKMG